MLSAWYYERQENTLAHRETFISGEQWGYVLMLGSSSGNPISEAMSCDDPRDCPSTTDNMSSASLRFNDESVARRVAEAFHHASDLCRKKEPF
jgi:hypothetical protein